MDWSHSNLWKNKEEQRSALCSKHVKEPSCTHTTRRLLLDNDIRRSRIQPNPDSLQFCLHLTTLVSRFRDVHDNENQIRSLGCADDLSTSTETHRGAGNDTGKIEQLDSSAFKFEHPWNGLKKSVVSIEYR